MLTSVRLPSSDWIALNVLRNVALSTSSVAASVEPVMQQHFFSLSPMMGQEPSYATPGSQQLMGQTPTTTSMLAALQQDPFPAGSLDPSAPFNPENYGLPNYLDAGATHDDPLAGHQGGLSFSEYVGSSANTFDVSGFVPHDLGLAHPGGEHEASESDVKVEGAAQQ